MAATLAPEVYRDDIALSLARVMATANARARELGVDATQSLITVTQRPDENRLLWRVSYGPKDYIGRRGGDLILDIEPDGSGIAQVRRGQ